MQQYSYFDFYNWINTPIEPWGPEFLAVSRVMAIFGLLFLMGTTFRLSDTGNSFEKWLSLLLFCVCSVFVGGFIYQIYLAPDAPALATPWVIFKNVTGSITWFVSYLLLSMLRRTKYPQARRHVSRLKLWRIYSLTGVFLIGSGAVAFAQGAIMYAGDVAQIIWFAYSAAALVMFISGLCFLVEAGKQRAIYEIENPES